VNEPVAVFRGPAEYPSRAPYDPSEAYPELVGVPVTDEPNHAFVAVRECLRLAGCDAARFGTADWNPLGRWIRPGMTVLLKPNFVRERHPRDPEGWLYTITHGSIVRAAAEYVARSLEGRGTIVVGDAPQTDSSFSKIAGLTGLESIKQRLESRGIAFEVVDFRREEWEEQDGVIVGRRELPGDPRGYVAFDLAEKSRFADHRGAGRYYGAFYDDGLVNAHHSGGRHEYLLTGSAVKCDVYLNLPKLKTHKKTGVTLNLKNLVGINGDKNWLPHHTEGHPGNGGDQFPSGSAVRTLERYAGKVARRIAANVPVVGPRVLKAARSVGTRVAGDTETVVRSGNWHGNDTTWRMSLDLNACLLWGTAEGFLRTSGEPRPYLSIVDGLLAGEGSGPLNPDLVKAGVVAFGSAPADVDAACAWLMGLDPERIPVIREAYARRPLPIAAGSWREIVVESNHEAWSRPLSRIARQDSMSFRPHFGWVGHVERRD
jgi:uncharacterized protein (DUF362 family)